MTKELMANQRGFSLLEALLVAGIISGLAAISAEMMIHTNRSVAGSEQKAGLVDDHLLLTQTIVKRGGDICVGMNLTSPTKLPTTDEAQQLVAFRQSPQTSPAPADAIAEFFRDYSPTTIPALATAFPASSAGKPQRQVSIDPASYICEDIADEVRCKTKFYLRSQSQLTSLRDLSYELTLVGSKKDRIIQGCEFAIASESLLSVCTSLGGEIVDGKCRRKTETCPTGQYLKGYDESGSICEPLVKLTLKTTVTSCGLTRVAPGTSACQANCPAGYSVTGGGFNTGSAYSDNGRGAYPNGNGFYCIINVDSCSSGIPATGCNSTCYANCAKVD